MAATTILARPGAARTVFGISFIGSVAILYWILWLRGGIFDPQGVRIFHRLFLFEDYFAAYALIGVLLLALVPSIQSWGASLATVLGRHPMRSAIATTVVCALGARFAYFAHPLSMDEYAAVFQSEVFAAGKLTGHFPPAQVDWLVPVSFQNVFFIVSHDTGAVVSAYWPGFALLMSPFAALGVPWLCNPVLAGATVLALHRLAMDLFDDRGAAGLVLLLTLASSAFAINAISFYSMPAHLLANVLFIICICRRQVAFAFLAGLIGGYALVLHNPFPHALFAGPWIVWILFQQNRVRLTSALLLGYLPIFLFLGIGWTHLIQELRAESLPDVAAANVGGAVGSALDGLLQSAQRIFQPPATNVLFARAVGVAKLWLWASPGLIVLACWGAWRARADARLLLIAASGIATLIGYLFYPADQGHGWGFRYFQSAWLALPILAVAGAIAKDRLEQERRDLCLFVAGCALASLVLINALRTYQVHDFIEAHLAQMPSTDRGTPVLKVIRIGMGYYAQDLIQNDPFLRNRPVIAITRGTEENAAFVREHYSELTLLELTHRGSIWGVPAAR